MATAKPLGRNRSITLERNKVITLTKRTVRFSRNVYQTHNIAEFGEGEVDIGTIPWLIIIPALFLALILITTDEYSNGVTTELTEVGLLLILTGIGGTAWNIFKPKHYGFLLTLNSGDKKLFITSDKAGLKEVIEEIYKLIEEEKEVTYQISVKNSKINGNLIQEKARDLINQSDN